MGVSLYMLSSATSGYDCLCILVMGEFVERCWKLIALAEENEIIMVD